MEFEKYIFSVELHGWSVAKYTEEEKVILVAEHADEKIGETISFDSVGKYEAWVDSVVEHDIQIENQYESVRLVLAEMEKTELTGRGGAGRGQGRKPSDDPRSVRKQLRWTENEWNLIETFAGKESVSVADFQRNAILDKCN